MTAIAAINPRLPLPSVAAMRPMEVVAFVGIVALLLVKEAGVPIPVLDDLVVVGTGGALAAEVRRAVDPYLGPYGSCLRRLTRLLDVLGERG